MPRRTSLPSIGPILEYLTSVPARLTAWLILLTVTGLLVKTETRRPDLPAGVTLSADLVYRLADGRRERLDVYLPAAPPPPGGYPVIVAVHGGGWQGGGKAEYGRSLVPLVEKGMALVAIDYKLARPGRPPWPENVRDVREAVRWVRDHAESYRFDPDRVALLGASAGAHLALMAAYPPRAVTQAPSGRNDPADGVPVGAVIDFYGPTDLGSLHSTSPGAAGPVEALTGTAPGGRAGIYEQASPRRQVRPGGPPVLIFHGTDDLLVPIEQSRGLAQALEAAGVGHNFFVVREARHGFGLRAQSTDLVPVVLEFLRTAWEHEDSVEIFSRPASRSLTNLFAP